MSFAKNQSAIKLLPSDAYRPRTKHIDIRHHRILEQLFAEIIKLQYEPSKKFTNGVIYRMMQIPFSRLGPDKSFIHMDEIIIIGETDEEKCRKSDEGSRALQKETIKIKSRIISIHEERK